VARDALDAARLSWLVPGLLEDKVAELLRGLPAQVNLIPLNPTAGYAGVPTRSEAAKRFQHILATEFNLPSTVRQRRGIDIAAGCGQLAVAEQAN
jgi:23S rRNA (adenine2503-C2)-methyltransferase